MSNHLLSLISNKDTSKFQMTCRPIGPYNSIELIVESDSTPSLGQIPALSLARNFQATMNSELLEYPNGIEQQRTYFLY